jgi:Flp pilus assembly protein TadG
MMSPFARDQEGQALVIVAVCVMVLLAALGFAVDVGHSLTLRRVSQNEADAATLAVGKMLATSVSATGGLHFTASQQAAWCLAKRFRDDNSRFEQGVGNETVSVSFSADATAWSAAISGASCPASGTGTAIPTDTLFVRVRVESRLRTISGAFTGQSLTSGATATARVAGSTIVTGSPYTPEERHASPPLYAPAPATWPLTRRFNLTDYQDPCGPYCDPNGVPTIRFWPLGNSETIGEFKGLLSPSHSSTRITTLVHQYLTESDYSGTSHLNPAGTTTPLPNQSVSASCSAGMWDTWGGVSSSGIRACGLPNWFHYGFRGRFGLGSNWALTGWGGLSRDDDYVAGNEAPDSLLLGLRTVCDGLPPFFNAPSCAAPSLGDWMETALGGIDDNMIDRMREFIAREGHAMPFSSATVASGPNAGNTFGRAVVIPIFLWDCAERYDSAAAAGSQWSLVIKRADDEDEDCSKVVRGSARRAIDRVHAFTVIPFTFYEGLVTRNAVEAHWGGAFAAPGRCQADPGPLSTLCMALNPLINTAFLVHGG